MTEVDRPRRQKTRARQTLWPMLGRHKQGSGSSSDPSWWHSLHDPEYQLWLARACFYEFLGTFILIYIQAASGETLIRLGAPAFVNDALGHGLAGLVATYICVHVSGAMFNPALTLGFWLSARIDFLTMLGYWVMQVAGSLAGAGLLRGSIRSLTQGLGVPRLNTALSEGEGILIIATLGVFMFWFFAMAMLRGRYFFYRGRYRIHGNSPMYPAHAALMAFGWNGAVEAAFVNTVGSGPNPVRWLGPAIVAGRDNDWAVWSMGPFIGVVIGVGIYALDVILLRPNRARVNRNQEREADHRQRRRQSTPHPRAPEPPFQLPAHLTKDLDRELVGLL